ncbi:response regulator [Paenibacillus hodogayensis]|uniref:Response regulator n=1 Tax=Paenibacillus hodogayensis TaxID=279208 RepID=A0ABV5VR37_9BACL
MKAILVDDEMLALRYLEKKLVVNGQIEVIGKYLDVEEALEAVTELSPDVIFLDIDMPGLSGIEAAELLAEKAPATSVVFITAYEEYALKAFELNAVDYLLKPVEDERLSRTVLRLSSRMQSRMQSKQETEENRPAMLRCFQIMEFDLDKPEAIPWRTTKAQELFAYLVHYRDSLVRKDVLLELLWPEVDVKRGNTQLYTAVYQIRKTMDALGIDIRIVSFEKGYRLELNGMKLDVEEWERGVMQEKEIRPDNLDRHYRLLDLYRGDYFAEYDYLWAESERERLKTIWLRHALAVAEWLDGEERRTEAVSLYYRIVRMFPYSEQVYFALMQQYDKLGEWTSVDKWYAELEHILQTEFGADVSETIRTWYDGRKPGKRTV